MTTRYPLALAWTLLALAGCGKGEFEIVPVSGKVTLNGQPLANASVSFESLSAGAQVGPGSGGETDAEGRYSLTTIEGRRGAVVGDHRVVISTLKYAENRSDSARVKKEDIQVPEKVPPKYNRETGLTFKVPDGGTDQANFDLTGPTPARSSKKP